MNRPLATLRRALLSSSLRVVLVAGLACGLVACGSGSGTSDDDPSRSGDGGSQEEDGGPPDYSDATYELDANDIDYISETGTGPGIDSGGPAVCGNGKFEEKELCDDGNTNDGDGCSADCSTVDPDYLCLDAGQACQRVVICGNGVIEGSEVCDDGDQTPEGGDGCSADCKEVESGFTCFKPGEACVRSPVCGNGQRERGEQCDDGESPPESGDGCDASCQLENASAWFCPPGNACIPLVCGDGVRTPNEQCDDGDNPPAGGDGCDASCRLEPGFRCGASGCRPICGDGLLVSGEECDDSDLVSGDGCSAACKREPFFTCPSSAGDCTSSIVCGDGCVDPGEICDPGNLQNRCGQADASCFSTSENAAQACKAFEIVSDPGVCGDGTVNLNEQCDPACTTRPCNIPGCNNCQITSGWACPRAGYCFQIPRCGDGTIQIGEECDPGPTSVAGCNPTTCRIVSGYYCSGTPSTCVRSVCGDGLRAPNEQCDDGPGTVNAPGTPLGGDGCSATCTVESGYVCPPNLACRPVCGNGVLQPGESCEEVSAGCSNCFIQPGYDCDVNGRNCRLTRCGAANTGTPAVERGEGCDDGNAIAGDLCSPTCQVEPTFTHNTSGTPTNTAQACGDGFKTLSEGCDDGNRTNGDGCSSTCTEESGWVCNENTITYPPTIDFRVTYRDFKARGQSGGHPHFKHMNEFGSGSDYGITGQLCTTDNYNATPGAATCGLLDSAGKPRHVKAFSSTIIDNTAAFGLWYRDSNSGPGAIAGANGTIQMYANPGTTASPGTAPTTPDTLRLTRVGTTSAYQYPAGSSSSANFFNLDGRGFGNTPGQSHNFNFTTELRYFFQYRGGEELLFEGDDDVWVYVNGRLAVDVGGIHCPQVGRVVLGDQNGSCNLQVPDNGSCSTPSFSACTSYTSSEQSDATDDRFAITKGQVYEIVLFHAERNPTGSNFRLTLDGFLAPRSTCTTTCGDGIRAGNEICDTASAPSSGYNVCLNNCTIRFCGDGTVQAPNETCDSATKVTYRQTAGGCGFDCRAAPYCGDGVVQAFAGEVCDDGVNSGAYGSCTSNCKGFGGYCGDGTVNGPEQCDSATKVAYQANGQGCGFDCKWAPSCGDGTRNGPETCEPPNTAQCNSACQVQPFCGDGIQSPGEACDYGTFNEAPASVAYGGCTTGCALGPRCGDMVRQESAGEECDDGSANSPAANPTYDACTTACLNGPRCGDGIRQSSQEACDNGFNEDTYAHTSDACGPGCAAVPFCGDGVVQSAVEQCDNGTANADGAYDGCRSDCQWGPYCGDGVKNGSEDCDDPNGNVAYSADGSGCSFECKSNVPSCGDGVRNGPEQCDDGKASNTGAYGGCNANCTRAPHCGDRMVQEQEVCDDGPTGSADCTQSCTPRVILL